MIPQQYRHYYTDAVCDFNTNSVEGQKKQSSFLLDVHCPVLAKRCINELVVSTISKLLNESVNKHFGESRDGSDKVRYNTHNNIVDIRNVLCNLDGEIGETVSFYTSFFTLLALVMENVNQDWETCIDNLRTISVDRPKVEKELSSLLLVASTSRRKSLTVDSIKLTMQDCNQLVTLTLSSQYLVFIAAVLYQMSKMIQGESKLVLLRESFLVLNYSHAVDPSNSELALILVGETLVQDLKQNNHPYTKPSMLLIEFVLKRLLTCNLGTRKQFAQMHVNQLYQNIESRFRDNFTQTPIKNYMEDLLCSSEKNYKPQYFLGDLYEFRETKENAMTSLYKALNAVYNERDFSINEKAHKLAWIYNKVIENNCEEKFDQVEGFVLLMNSVHNFNILLSELNNKEDREILFPTCSKFWVENGDMNCFNVKAYYFTIDTLYSIMLKSNFCPPLRHIKSLETHFPYILLTQSLNNLKKLAEANVTKTSKPEPFGNLDFLPVSPEEKVQMVISEMITLLHSGWCYEPEKLPEEEISKLESIDAFVSNNAPPFNFD